MDPVRFFALRIPGGGLDRPEAIQPYGRHVFKTAGNTGDSIVGAESVAAPGRLRGRAREKK
mgnify:CR=1 FL=1